jgi:hypothetical protein
MGTSTLRRSAQALIDIILSELQPATKQLSVSGPTARGVYPPQL